MTRGICTLIGGPQDGALVKSLGQAFPGAIYVGPTWLGDGFAAWAAEGSQRFPAAYVYAKEHRFVFNGWSQE